MDKIRVVLADDHALVRAGVRNLLEMESDMEVIGEAGDGIEALKVVRSLKPDVLLLDLSLPKMGGLDTLKMIKSAGSDTEVVILSMHQKEAYIHELIKNGATGYVTKLESSSAVVEAVRAAARKEFYLSPQLRPDKGTPSRETYLNSNVSENESSNPDQLTEREKQILRLIVEGNTANQIGDILCISPKTVEKHRANIVGKIKQSHPVDMMKYAVRIGLVDPDSWG